jgi:hypothetical protein
MTTAIDSTAVILTGYGVLKFAGDYVFRRATDVVFETLVRSCPALVALLFRARVMRSNSPSYYSAFIGDIETDPPWQTVYESVPVNLHRLNCYDVFSGIFKLNEDRTTTRGILSRTRYPEY